MTTNGVIFVVGRVTTDSKTRLPAVARLFDSGVTALVEPPEAARPALVAGAPAELSQYVWLSCEPSSTATTCRGPGLG